MHLASEPSHHPQVPSDEDHQYTALLRSIRTSFRAAVKDGTAPLFVTTPPADIWERFINYLPPERRQHYNCNACKRFVRRYGALVTVTEDGRQIPVMWDSKLAPAFFRSVVDMIETLVSVAPITGVFLASEEQWGTEKDEVAVPPYEWHHMAVTPPEALIYKGAALNAKQAMAAKREDYAVLLRGLADFSINTVKEAHTHLTTGALDRQEHCIGVAEWLINLHKARADASSRVVRDRLTWLAVAQAPAGFCHVRNTVIATLLQDIANGLPFSQIQRRFNEKMDPLKYQRAQVAPSAGVLAQAESLVAKFGSAGAFKRRFATLADVRALWTPRPPTPSPTTGGVFRHIAPKGSSPRGSATKFEVQGGRMTWERFRTTILPTAESIEVYIRPGHGSYMAMVTAVDPNAPPILQWDRPEKRNPVSWYFHGKDSTPDRWNLTAHTWQPVTAVTYAPNMWSDPQHLAQHGRKVFFLLKNCRDVHAHQGGGFFPEMLKSDYHSIRSAMEAYANTAAVIGREEASACGLGLSDGKEWDCQVRVTSGQTTTTITLDRWS